MTIKKNTSGATTAMYSGDLSFMNCPRCNLEEDRIPSKSIVVLGVPFDTSTSNRPGTRFGPRAIRQASKLLSWQKVYGWKEDLYGAETDRSKKVKVLDAGDVDFDYGYQKSIVPAIDAAIQKIVQASAKPLILGGDHFISYPILQSIYKSFQGTNQKIALVHFDAHSDTWDDVPDRIDHGTGFFHAIKKGIIDPKHSIQIGIRTCNDNNFGIKVIDSFKAHTLKASEIVKAIKNRIGKLPVYLTLDIDVFDPAYAPGTGTPVTGGLTPNHVLSILKELASLNLVGADVVEVSPPYDHGEITALLGATIASYLGHLLSKSNW